MSEPLFPMVILAGGLATRLRPLTQSLPKALLPIHKEPFIAHQLRLLAQKGIRDIVMCVGFLGEQIEAFVGDGSRFNLHVSYVYDGEMLLGTAGSIKRALSLLPDTFFVLNGDSYLPCDYQSVQKAYESSGKQALMTVYKNKGKWDASNVEMHQDQIVTYDKQNRTSRMLYIDYGLEIFSRKVFDKVPDNVFYDLGSLYQSLIKCDTLAAFEVKMRFYENGSLQGIADLKDYLAG